MPYKSLTSCYQLAYGEYDDVNMGWKLYIHDKKIPCTGVNGLTATGINTNIEAGQGVSNLRIGSHYGGNNGSAYFNGKVKQVRLYGRAIKEEEIQLSYDGGCGADPEDKSQLVLWLPLNEKTGTTVHDLSSYGLTATTSNPYFEEIPSGLNGCLEKLAYCQNNASQNVADGRNYRYAFNGKESDDETYGDGDEYDYGARIYDPRLGRWMSVDPSQLKYPSMTPYLFSGNSPITFYDPNGKEIQINYIDKNGKAQSYVYTPGIKPAIDNEFVNKVHEAISYNMHSAMGAQVWEQLSASEGVLTIGQNEAKTQGEAEIFTPGGTDVDKSGHRIIGNIAWDANSPMEQHLVIPTILPEKMSELCLETLKVLTQANKKIT